MIGKTDGIVIGIDIDIRAHNRDTIEKHPMAPHIRLIEGSSIAPETVGEGARGDSSRAPKRWWSSIQIMRAITCSRNCAPMRHS